MPKGNKQGPPKSSTGPEMELVRARVTILIKIKVLVHVLGVEEVSVSKIFNLINNCVI